MKSIDTRLTRLEQSLPAGEAFQLLAIANSPQEASQIRTDLAARGTFLGLLIHTYTKLETRHEG